jgi:hypothetical protein
LLPPAPASFAASVPALSKYELAYVPVSDALLSVVGVASLAPSALSGIDVTEYESELSSETSRTTPSGEL